MHKTQAKIQSMSTAEWHTYNQLLENRRLVDYFADEIMRLAHSQLKPDDVLRRFSLNGDGQLDLKEFQLAMKRLGIVQPSNGYGTMDHNGANGLDAAAQRKTKELFSVFCPSNNKKLDIDMFCRIMAEWSLQLMRAQHDQRQNQQRTHSRTGIAPIPTPYAIENASQSSGVVSSSANSEGEMIWRRIRDSVVHNLDKLSQIFSKMDISSTGCVCLEEYELAMSHIGIFLTAREFEKLYEALPMELKDFPSDSDSFMIRYADFLSTVQNKNPDANKHALPGSSQTSSPPIATNARLWDLLLLALDKLEPLIVQYEKAHQRYVSAETFRDILTRSGITLSNPDYAALRVRLLPFADSNGHIGLSALLDALKVHDHSNMVTAVHSSAFANPPPLSIGQGTGIPTVSPIRTGRKTLFPTVNELTPPSLYQSRDNSAAVHPAGKSNEQRNHEANRSMIKIRDESRWNSNINFHNPPDTATDIPQYRQDPSDTDDGAGPVKPLALEKRILTKLQQVKDVGHLGSTSPQSVFPADRFGRITRGQLRQSLVHLGLVARYAEVEGLFWTLDPSGRGYMAAQEFYDHLNVAATKIAAIPQSANGNWSLPELSPTHAVGGLTRSVQKIFEAMLLQYQSLFGLCQRFDTHRTGLITRGELTAAIHELGILASPQDVQTAVVAITQRVELSKHAGDSSTATAEPYHPSGIVYSKIDARLKQLCSDLLSPKKRRQHLSTASVLLAPQETQAFATAAGCSDNEYNMNIANETDALWNCPRRKMNQDHRAMKSSIQITDQVYDSTNRASESNGSSSPTGSETRGLASDKTRAMPRGRRLTIISILQDLLERRGDLKSVVDLHRNADVHGQVNKADLVEILMASRLSLNFSNSLPSGITARDFVDVLYPQTEPLTVSFLDLLHRISDLLNDLTRTTPAGANTTTTGMYSNNAYPRETARRMQTSGGPGKPNMSVSPILVDTVNSPRTVGASSGRTMSLFASDELSLQRKLLYGSRLSDLLTTEKGRQSAAILIRHAFKGVMARELVVPIDNGEFEAVCRSSDIKYVCYRLGLDLDVGELHFLVTSIDVNQSGYISSPQLLQFFSHLAMRASHTSHSNSHPNGYSTPPREERLGSARAGLY